MQKLTLAAVLGITLGVTGFAGTHRIPEDKPVASVTVPDSWATDDIADGIEITSADGEVYMAIEATDADNVAEGMEEAVRFLKEKGVTVDQDTVKQEEAKINDMPVVDVSWDGKDEDGPARVTLMVVSVTDKEGLLVIYWASPEGEKKHQADITKIAKSIKKI